MSYKQKNVTGANKSGCSLKSFPAMFFCRAFLTMHLVIHNSLNPFLFYEFLIS